MLESPAGQLAAYLAAERIAASLKKSLVQQVDATDADVHSQDSNGKHYTFGPVPKEETTYPLFADDGEGGFTMPIVDKLLDWGNSNPDDLRPKRADSKPWFLNLRIGATQLKTYLKAKKRELIHNAVRDLSIVETKLEMCVTRDAEVDDGRGREHFDPEEVEIEY